MIRNPLRAIYATGATNTGSLQTTFVIPFDDFDSIVVKYVWTTIIGGATPNMSFFVQTSDDGGTTFYDVASFPCVHTGAGSTYWAAIPVKYGEGKYIGTVSDGTLAAGSVNGMPLLSKVVRLKWISGGTTVTYYVATPTLYANNQSSR